MSKITNLNTVYSIVAAFVAIFNIYGIIFNNIAYCDTPSISELWFNDNNLPIVREETQPIHSNSIESSNITFIPLKEKMKRKIYWYLFSKDFVEYDKFKQNWYTSRSFKKQIKVEVQDFWNNPNKYSTHKREWLLINNCIYYRDNPNGTFFVQGMGYLEARYVHYLTVKYGFVVHNDRFVKVNIKNIGNIISQIYINNP